MRARAGGDRSAGTESISSDAGHRNDAMNGRRGQRDINREHRALREPHQRQRRRGAAPFDDGGDQALDGGRAAATAGVGGAEDASECGMGRSGIGIEVPPGPAAAHLGQRRGRTRSGRRAARSASASGTRSSPGAPQPCSTTTAVPPRSSSRMSDTRPRRARSWPRIRVSRGYLAGRAARSGPGPPCRRAWRAR